jgi:hypothetical protein
VMCCSPAALTTQPAAGHSRWLHQTFFYAETVSYPAIHYNQCNPRSINHSQGFILLLELVTNFEAARLVLLKACWRSVRAFFLLLSQHTFKKKKSIMAEPKWRRKWLAESYK